MPVMYYMGDPKNSHHFQEDFTQSALAVGWKMTAAGAAPAKAVANYRTQKAKGIQALNETGFVVPHFEVHGIEEFVNPVNSNGQIALFTEEKVLAQLVDRFVRPCPMVPRHGFVDSRPIRTIEDAQKIVDETIKVEAQAELVCMPFIDSSYSAIWTEGKLIIGPSNDGATGGHASKIIPILGIPSRNTSMWEQACKLASITDAPYLELLWSKKYDYDTSYKNYYVQLRNGPKLPASIDFIPEEMEVVEIVEATGDLLEWETKAKAFSKGTVIHHPGGSLASHYAVHAVLNNIPVLISRKPAIGEKLIPNAEVSAPDARQIKAGFLLGCQHDMTYQQAALVMLVGCHSTALWAGKNDLMLGFALGAMYRLIITAALGEFRHAPSKKRKKIKATRNAVYNGVWNKILNQSTRTRYMAALESFENEQWSGSYGGKKWLDFSKYAGLIFNAVLDEDVTNALTLFNQAVHMAHNSGWAFDKFMNQEVLDETANNPAYTLIRCAPEFYKAQVTAEEKQDLADWYKWKKPFKIEGETSTKEEKARAKAAELAEEAEESESNDCGDCGRCGCESCNPDGSCGAHYCPHCYPDGCPIADECKCKECFPWGCSDMSCEKCHPPKPLVKKVESVQVHLNSPYSHPYSLKCQVKYEGQITHATKYLPVPVEKQFLVQKLVEVTTKKNKSYVSGLMYTVLEKLGNSFYLGKIEPAPGLFEDYKEGYYMIKESELQ